MPPSVLDGKRNPYDNASGPFRLDISEDIDFLAPERDTPTLRILGWGASADSIASASIGAKSLRTPCTSFKHSWLNDTLVPAQGTITANRASGAVVTVGTTQVNYFRVDDIIRIRSSAVAAGINDIFLQVTAINTGAGTLTVTALNTDQAATSGDAWQLMGQAKVVGAAANTTGKFTVLTQADNYTQIFSDDIVVTGTEEAVEQYGIQSPMERETNKTVQRLMVEFERAVLFSQRSSAIPSSSSTASRMGGIFYWLRVASGGLSLDMAGAPVSERLLDSALDTIWRAGGEPDIIMCNSVPLREMKNFIRSSVRTERSETTFGLVMDRYESPHGLALDVVLNRHLSDTDLVILTKAHMGVGPLEGNGNSRHFTVDGVPYTGADYTHRNIRGEYTMEVRNNTSSHMWLYGGASSVSS